MKYSECKTEQAFKMEWLRRNKGKYLAAFPIETEETVKGFPDVLLIEEGKGGDQTPFFVEFKRARDGRVTFQPTQPSFYKRNGRLFISVVSLVELKGKTYVVALPAPVVMAALKGGLRLDLRPFCVEAAEAV